MFCYLFILFCKVVVFSDIVGIWAKIDYEMDFCRRYYVWCATYVYRILRSLLPRTTTRKSATHVYGIFIDLIILT